MGNWLSREPMGESGSVNLYTFINNDSINAIDVLGLFLGKIGGMVTKKIISKITNIPSSRISGILKPTEMGDATIKYRKMYEYTPYEMKENFIIPVFKGKSISEIEAGIGKCTKGMKHLEITMKPEFIYGGGLKPITRKGYRMGLQPVTPNPYYNSSEPQLVPAKPVEYIPEHTPPEFITKTNIGSIIETGSDSIKKIGTVDIIYKLNKVYRKAYF